MSHSPPGLLPVAVTILNTMTIAVVAFSLERPNEIMPSKKHSQTAVLDRVLNAQHDFSEFRRCGSVVRHDRTETR